MNEQKFSHYLVGRKLGQGGMGELYLAEDTQLGRRVALKFLAPSQIANQKARDRLLQEARAAAAIDHPYICKIYEAGEFEGTAFIAMEFVDGMSLLDRMRRGAMSFEQAVQFTIEIAEALAKAHECGVLHRDLKPSNVMLTLDNHVKVVDFGLAKRLHLPAETETMGSALTNPGLAVGTLSYMSPEQLRQQPLDARSDIFQLGIVFYQMLTGRHPFYKASAMEMVSGILKEAPPPLLQTNPQCPAALQPVVSRMLHKEPGGRYASARDVAQELRAPSSSSLNAVLPRSASTPTDVVASVAVLPFINRGRGEEDEYFSDGVTEEIIIRLSKVWGLRVISFHTAMRLKNSDKALSQIGQELGVETVLTGSVGRAGQRVRVRAGLTDVATDSQIWGEAYDRDASDVLTIQAEVAEEIAHALAARFPLLHHQPASRPEASVNVESYDHYLKGRHAASRATPQGFQQAWRHFQMALEIDSTYAPIYAAMAVTYARAGNYGFLPPQDAAKRARVAAQAALSFDPRLAEAHTAVGLVAMYYDWDWPAAEAAFQRALELNPNFADAHMFYAVCLMFTLHRREDALREARLAVDLDPLSALAASNLALLLLHGGHKQEALEQVEKTLCADPDYLPARAIQATVFWALGRYEEGNRILEQFSWTRAHLGWGYAMSGRHAEARNILHDLTSTSHPATFDIAMLCLFLGDLKDALGWLERAWLERDNKLYSLRAILDYNDLLRPYLSEPRMQDFLARIAPRHSTDAALMAVSPTNTEN